MVDFYDPKANALESTMVEAFEITLRMMVRVEYRDLTERAANIDLVHVTQWCRRYFPHPDGGYFSELQCPEGYNSYS